MAEIGSVQQPGAAKPPEDASTGIGAPAAEPATTAAAAPDGVVAATRAPEPAHEAAPPPGVEDPVVEEAQDTIVKEPAVRLAVVGDPAPPTAPADGARATSFVERAVLRRRIRFLRRRRELALHDLGGFVYETHRLGEELIVLHEPGISSCIHCSTIHDSAARFCPGCGRPTSGLGA